MSLTTPLHAPNRKEGVADLNEELILKLLRGIEGLLHCLESRQCFYDEQASTSSGDALQTDIKLVIAQGIFVMVKLLRNHSSRAVKLQCIKCLNSFVESEETSELKLADLMRTTLLLYELEAALCVISQLPSTVVVRLHPALAGAAHTLLDADFEDIDEDLPLTEVPRRLLKKPCRSYLPRLVKICSWLLEKGDPHTVVDVFVSAVRTIDVQASSNIWLLNRLLECFNSEGQTELLSLAVEVLSEVGDTSDAWEITVLSCLVVEGIGIATKKSKPHTFPIAGGCIYLDHPNALVRRLARDMIPDAETLGHVALEVFALRLQLSSGDRRASSDYAFKEIFNICDQETLEKFGVSIERALKWLSFETDQRAMKLMNICESYVECLPRMYPVKKPPVEERPAEKEVEIGAVTQTLQILLSSWEDEVTEISAEKKESSVSEAESDEELHPHTQMTEAMHSEEEKKRAPPHVKRIARIVHAATTMILRRHPGVSVSALTTARRSLLALVDYPDELLPEVHFMWSSLLEVLQSEEQSNLERRVQALALVTVATQVSRDFVRPRFTKDLLPSMVALIESLNDQPKRKPIWKYSLEFKFQKEVLSNVALIVKAIGGLDVAEMRLVARPHFRLSFNLPCCPSFTTASNFSMSPKYYVTKRDGRKEPVHFDKITSRIQKLCYGLNMDFVEPEAITMKVIAGLYPGVTTVELDNLAAETAATLTTKHPDYAVLAARIAVSNLHKETKKTFSEVMKDLHSLVNEKSGKAAPLLSDFHYKIISENAARLDSAIVYDRDYSYNYFGFKTLERSYLLRKQGKVVERPQHMLMRVAVGIHGEDLDAAIETYDLLSGKWFTHASPTLFNAATCRPQLSSCFLLTMRSDSIEGIYETLMQCALISKSAGGIGLNVHCIRATGSYIGGTNGTSNGLVPMLRVYNNTARYVDQGGNKRPGAFAIYLEPWHADVFEFLDLRKNTGKEEHRARDLFYALWIPDLFMRRVEEDGIWSLMCPNECPGLHECWGEEFDELYMRYEKEGKFRKQIKAQSLWFAILESQVETGTPYMLYKDACNRKSNQQNLGTIKCSNLCTEIVEYSSPDEVAVCNLASIALNMFVKQESKTYDFQKLKEVTKVVTQNLNKIIDVNYYPVPEAKRSNMLHRPIGIGVQGLADAFILMRYPFESPEAQLLNKQIFETIYYGALEASCELAEKLGPYETYEGSPVSRGILQQDMWNVTPTNLWDWGPLREKIAKHGVRNSLLLAPMPTASTAQILGNNESIEAYTSNIYTRRVLSGEFQVVNHHLLRDLTDLGIWDEDMKHQIIAAGGSVRNIDRIPQDLQDLYKTTWEISQKVVIQMAADRGAFIDQSQSLNIHIAEPNTAKLTSMHFFAWKSGLKTGMYYLRTKPAANPIQFTLDRSKLKNTSDVKQGRDEVDEEKEKQRLEELSRAALVCSLQNKEDCMMCGA
ncbi:unnamed protein product [Cyprideis torosa]|uniref:Ribonucleoside-diphosphate reductase n=1 Tax=Cyprideis torosa TaxID=163714 RepID=A0A7R8ZH41_9CRUS|nr:unnamed protein product [Cyprideis torosa]CAG0881694.1 unnamed protein product [Cyprideis torosa]